MIRKPGFLKKINRITNIFQYFCRNDTPCIISAKSNKKSSPYSTENFLDFLSRSLFQILIGFRKKLIFIFAQVALLGHNRFKRHAREVFDRTC